MRTEVSLPAAEVKPIRFTLNIKGTPIGFTIEGDMVTADWWTPEVKEIMCGLCPKKANCDPNCLTANPWCG